MVRLLSRPWGPRERPLSVADIADYARRGMNTTDMLFVVVSTGLVIFLLSYAVLIYMMFGPVEMIDEDIIFRQVPLVRFTILAIGDLVIPLLPVFFLSGPWVYVFCSPQFAYLPKADILYLMVFPCGVNSLVVAGIIVLLARVYPKKTWRIISAGLLAGLLVVLNLVLGIIIVRMLW